MTVIQFDQILGYLLAVMMPPNVSDDVSPNPKDVLDVLLKYVEEVRGHIIQRNITGTETED